MKYLAIVLSVLLISVTANSQTWVQKLNGRSVWSLAKDVNGNLFAGGLTAANSRIWKSSDGGNSWDTIYIGGGSTMWGIAFDMSGNMYVANFSDGLLKSTNGGMNFTALDTSHFNGKRPQGVACGVSGHVYITTASGFFRSTDFGSSFTETALTGSNVLPVVVDKDSMNIIYAGVSSAGGVGIGFYRSTDYGLTFGSNLNPGKNGYNIYQNTDGSVYMITTTSPYAVDRSTNKGLSWTTLGNALATPRGITIDLSGNIYLAGNGGAYKSTNGGANFVNFNLTGSCTPALSYQNKILVGASGGTAGVYIYTDSTISGTIPIGNTFPGSYSLSQNFPNPFNPETNIKYSIPTASNVKLTLHDVTGREVVVLLNEYKNPGFYDIKVNASRLSSGVYFYRIETEGFNAIRKMIVIK